GNRASIAANLGYAIRNSARIGDTELSDAVTYGLAADVGVGKLVGESNNRIFHIVGEMTGHTVYGVDHILHENSPLEGHIGGKVFPIESLMVEAGVGTGFVPGFGAPDWR